MAQLYDVETRALNQAVRRNIDRFPADFMFSLTREEIWNLSQFVISSKIKHAPNVFAFTEHGVAMLSSVLKSPRAVQVNIQIMRTFAKLREIMSQYKDVVRRLDKLEKKYDTQFKIEVLNRSHGYKVRRKFISISRKMPRINEATDTDLKVIEELTKLGWKRRDTLLYQQEYALSPEHQKIFDGRKSIKPDITLTDINDNKLALFENKFDDEKKALTKLRTLYAAV